MIKIEFQINTLYFRNEYNTLFLLPTCLRLYLIEYCILLEI